ncbi:helix-turn-helix domain-containing protein [Umezawaea sp. Da 62-37]|uniref:TetR/AcrR family transcriptional regulator n=1 Tax=Umezawaea sp. Da 62-37 TaxID=3075927 RepID=UPI0028F72E72|nr:helix-turn-helix domain-containing protein [Umezawaea sp. Da 62-37]WNV85779.1 helix-turn-helix domain-containing protein [Umezawaea sp. Da 62-37]
MAVDSGMPLRADARRNRDQIIAAARTIFVEQGPDAPMEEIARAAGVGVGTLYRRFPDRESLIREVAGDSLARAVTEARASIDEEPTCWAALVRFIGFSHELRLSLHLAMISTQAGAIIRDDPTTEQYRQVLLTDLDRMVTGAQAEGEVRSDIGTGDVAMLFVLLMRRLPNKLEEIEGAAERCMALMLDGLRARPGSRLPSRPITYDDLLG